MLAPAFYARQDTATPVKAGIASMLSNMVMNAIFVGIWLWFDLPGAHAGLTLSSALAGYINMGLLLVWLKRSGNYRPASGWRRYAQSLFLASVATILVLWWLPRQLPALPSLSAPWRLAWLTLVVAAAGSAYLLTAFAAGLRPRHLRDRSTVL